MARAMLDSQLLSVPNPERADLERESLDGLRIAHHRAEPGKAPREPLFQGMFVAGFECSDHRLEDGRRLDLLETTRHEALVAADYARLRGVGMTAAREGVSWVRSERVASSYDFSAASSRLRAAARHGVELVWDLMHFGWPDHVDVFSPSFPAQFGRYAGAFARFLSDHTERAPRITPINEMSFLAWAGGDVRCMNPFEAARGVELKVQLVLATIEAIEAVRAVWPEARFVQPEPLIHIVPDPAHPRTRRRVESDNLLQYQAWDMLCGRVWPRLGGHPSYLDIVGVNFYEDNQFMLDGTTIWRGDASYRPFSTMLREVWQRYGRPLIVSETGSEGARRASWLRYVAEQCVEALREGVELHAITLYPVLNHPGWLDDRHCENGLWDYADEHGERAIHAPLAEELATQTPRLMQERARMLAMQTALEAM
jgi:hypothetical protein